MLHGLGSRLKNRPKWIGTKEKKELYTMNKAKRKNFTKHNEQKTWKHKYNND